MTKSKRSPWRLLIDVPAEIIVAIYVLLDALFTPLFRPILRLLSQLAVVRRLERWIAGMHPYMILVLLGVPFIIAELTKVFAVFLMSEGHYRTGMTLFIGAYIVSIFVCERIFHAGKAQLLTIGWFATGFNWLMALKDHVFGWLRATRLWAAAVALKQKVRVGFRLVRSRVRQTFATRPRGAFER